MNTNSIEAISLSKQYPGFALEDVSFTLPQGCIMGFIGQNGAGKTTTIKRLLGLVQGGGEVHLLGEKEGYGLRKVKEQVGVLNCTPFVRQYDILSNKWGVLLCQKEYQTNDIRQNSKNW